MARRMILGTVVAAAIGLTTVPTATSAAGSTAQGNVGGAAMTCVIDTYAYDTPTVGRCRALWRPGKANDPTIVMFSVTGLSAGSYTYTWTNLETGSAPVPACGNVGYCSRSIATDRSGDGYAALSVKITDRTTGATKTVSAAATYLDGWT